MKRWASMVAVSLLLTSCLIETIPDSPGNAAITFASALLALDLDTTESLMCQDATSTSVDFDDPATFGVLAEFYQRQLDRDVFGAGGEYSLTEEVDLEVD